MEGCDYGCGGGGGGFGGEGVWRVVGGGVRGEDYGAGWGGRELHGGVLVGG